MKADWRLKFWTEPAERRAFYAVARRIAARTSEFDHGILLATFGEKASIREPAIVGAPAFGRDDSYRPFLMAQAGLELGVDPLFSSFANRPIMPQIDFFGRIGLETSQFRKRIFGASSVKLAAQCC